MQTIIQLLCNVLQFEQNFRAVIIENYGGAFAKYTNESYTMRPFKSTNSKNPVVTLTSIHNGEKSLCRSS